MGAVPAMAEGGRDRKSDEEFSRILKVIIHVRCKVLFISTRPMIYHKEGRASAPLSALAYM